jgi:acetyl/propionyl-CoA carboxylase alpha subunit
VISAMKMENTITAERSGVCPGPARAVKQPWRFPQ